MWICPWPNGHIQATGVDDAGRLQYRYHDEWRAHRDREKFDRVLRFARSLPDLRAAVTRDLATESMNRNRVLAASVRLLDRGGFRIGGEHYAEEHETFGIATLKRQHVTLSGHAMVFDYPAKGSIRRQVSVEDAESREVIARLKRRRGDDHLMAFKEGRSWVEVKSDDINLYIKEAAGEGYTAKDFRTWSATVLAATVLAEHDRGSTPTASKRKVTSTIRLVAEHLGNTPTVCRSSYIDPRVLDRFESGETIASRLAVLPSSADFDDLDVRHEIDQAVIALIEDEVGRQRSAA